MNTTAITVDRNANAFTIIPFNFEKRELRTLLIDDQPWFFAVDICLALALSDTSKALIGLDEDEKREHEQYSGSGRKPILINESGLYSLILRSRKAEAKRFKKWVTSVVLPAIRKHGRYEDASGRLGDLVGAVIGTSGVLVLDRVIEQKASPIAKGLHRSFKHTIKSRLRSRFNVQRADLIPADQLADACNFIAAYTLEGEWLAAEKPAAKTRLDIHFPVEYLNKGVRYSRSSSSDFLDVALHDLMEGHISPCEEILTKLAEAGYDVEGAWWEIRTYRNKLGRLLPMLQGIGREIASPQQYVIKRGAAA